MSPGYSGSLLGLTLPIACVGLKNTQGLRKAITRKSYLRDKSKFPGALFGKDKTSLPRFVKVSNKSTIFYQLVVGSKSYPSNSTIINGQPFFVAAWITKETQTG